jgi:hypothetical protein
MGQQTGREEMRIFTITTIGATVLVLVFCALTAIAIAAETGSLVVPSMDSGNYAAYCEEKWTKRGALNYEMYNYCLKEQREGYDKLTREVEAYKSLPWLQSVIDEAVKKWSKRGIRQDEMVAYTVHEQIDAYLDIAYLSKQPGYDKGLLSACFVKWNRSFIDWTMIRYCYKQATE